MSVYSVSDEVKKWSTLGKRRDVESWEMYPSMVNAYFNPPANEVLQSIPSCPEPFITNSLLVKIVFPAGILRPPFFSQDWWVPSPKELVPADDCAIRPSYLLYGAFGHVAAHELTVRRLAHAFRRPVYASPPLTACIRLIGPSVQPAWKA